MSDRDLETPQNIRDLKKITDFLTANKIPWRFGLAVNCLMQGLAKISKGVFVIHKYYQDNPAQFFDTQFSVIIHELAHFLSVPKSQRHLLDANLKGVSKIYISEWATRLMVFDLCDILDIDKTRAITIFMTGSILDRSHSLGTYKVQALVKFESQRHYKKSGALSAFAG